MYLLIATPDNDKFSLAIGKDKIEKKLIVKKEYRQSELLLRSIDQLVGNKRLTGIMVVAGPGAFSALRIGIVTANTLGYSLDLPVIGVRLEKDWLKLNEKDKLMAVWQNGKKKLEGSNGWRNQMLVKPFYDREPNITKPK